MIYKDLKFPKIKGRPFFYTNFVQTVDGKTVIGKTKDYWPLGSEKDFETFKFLRANADVFIHGSGSALWAKTSQNLGSEEIRKWREGLRKTRDLLYIVLTARPGIKLLKNLKDPAKGVKVLLVTTEESKVPQGFDTEVLRLGKGKVDIKKLVEYLYEQGYENVLMEGGPHTLGEFIREDLMDEIFLTIAPKIIGNIKDSTLTLVEGILFPPGKVKKLKLVSSVVHEDEIYLRYAIN